MVSFTFFSHLYPYDCTLRGVMPHTAQSLALARARADAARAKAEAAGEARRAASQEVEDLRQMVTDGVDVGEITKRRRSLEEGRKDGSERAEAMSLRVTRFIRHAAALCTGRIPPTPEMVKVTIALARARRRAARAVEARASATAKRVAVVRRLSLTDSEGESMVATIAGLAQQEGAESGAATAAPPAAPPLGGGGGVASAEEE